MKLLHLADVHLGASYAGFGDLAGDRSGEVLEAFRSLPDVAAAERVDAVLIAGDLFDRPQPDTATLAAVRETLRRLVDACIPTFLVPGNHDAATIKLNPYRELARASRVVVQEAQEDGRREWPLDDETGRRLAEKHSVYVLMRPRFGEPVTVETEAGPLHVYGLAFDSAECPDPLTTFRRHDAEGVHIGLLHAAVQDSSHWRASANTLTTTVEELQSLELDYIALGDFHRHRPPEELDGLPAAYPGCFAATDLTETGPRGYLLVEVEPGATPRVDHRDSGVRQCMATEVDVSSHTSDIAVAEAAARGLPPTAVPVVRLLGEPPYPLDADVVAAEVRERFGHVQIIDETRYYDSARLAELAELDTVAGHVVRLGRRRIEVAESDRDREVAQRALRVALRALGVE